MNPQVSRCVIKTQRYLQDRFPRLVVYGKIAAFRQVAYRRQNLSHRPVRQPLREAVHLAGGTPNTFATSRTASRACMVMKLPIIAT